MNMIFPHVHWITLDSEDSPRGASLKKSLSALGIPNTPFVAKRGDSFNLADDCLLKGAGARGCLSSHLEIIRKIAEGGRELAVVMEDDADPLGFMSRWKFGWEDIARRIPRDADILNMHVWHGGTYGLRRFYTKNSAIPMPLPHQPMRSCASYLITRRGARKLVDAFYDGEKWHGISLPVDYWLEMRDAEGFLNIYTIPILGTKEDMTSAISNVKMFLKMREASNRAVKAALSNGGPVSSSYLVEISSFFGKELVAIGSAIAIWTIASLCSTRE